MSISRLFRPKKISLVIKDEFLNKYFNTDYNENMVCPALSESKAMSVSPLKFASDLKGNSVLVSNISPFPSSIFGGWEMGTTEKFSFSSKRPSINSGRSRNGSGF